MFAADSPRHVCRNRSAQENQSYERYRKGQTAFLVDHANAYVAHLLAHVAQRGHQRGKSQDDDWSRLEQYFSEDAYYRPGDGTEAIGRAAVLQALRESVKRLERKCDSRDLVGEPELSESGDTITLKFSVKYTKQGLPDLILSGYETAQYSGGRILRMEDIFEDAQAMLEWTDQL